VHRDLKPANVLLSTEGRGGEGFGVKLTDFGIGGVAAQAANAAAEKATVRGVLTTSLRGSHTPLYPSTQQIRVDAPDPRDDVHAVGVIW